jgi:hypothetical protein
MPHVSNTRARKIDTAAAPFTIPNEPIATLRQGIKPIPAGHRVRRRPGITDNPKATAGYSQTRRDQEVKASSRGQGAPRVDSSEFPIALPGYG